MSDIRFAIPDVGRVEISNIEDTVNSRWIANGPKTREFEKQIAKMSGCDRAVAFDSCTGALEMALRVLGIRAGDEVITTPYTYSATAEVIRNVGAKIVFADIAEDGFEIDYQKIPELITERTKAIIPVDIGGKLCDYKSLYKVLESKKNLFKPRYPLQEKIGRIAVVADAAHSFTADMDNKVSGEFADFTCFSFHVLKNITTGGEGGAIVWKDKFAELNDGVEQTLRLLGDHGQTSRDKSNGWEYDIAIFGYNSIMTDIDASMGLAQLERFEEIREKRKKVTAAYNIELANQTRPFARPLIKHWGSNYHSAMHLYPVELAVPEGRDAHEFRNEVFMKLKEVGVPCNVHYKPLPMMTAYKNIGFDIKDYPNAYNRFSSLLTLPYHTELSVEDVHYVVEQLRKAVLSE